jgi:hypothetical protein
MVFFFLGRTNILISRWWRKKTSRAAILLTLNPPNIASLNYLSLGVPCDIYKAPLRNVWSLESCVLFKGFFACPVMISFRS